MQCFEVFLANEFFHIFDIKIADPVIEVSDPKNHTNVRSTEKTCHANINHSKIKNAFQKENIYGFILMLYDSLRWTGRVWLAECNTSANIFEILISPLILFNVGSQVRVDHTDIRVVEVKTDCHSAFVSLQIERKFSRPKTFQKKIVA